MVSFSIILGVLGTATYSIANLVNSLEMTLKYFKLPWNDFDFEKIQP